MFDVDAVGNEAEGIPFEFGFGGEKFTLPPEIDILAAASLEGGQAREGLHRLLGEEQWDRMVASKAVLNETKLKALMAAYAEHLGVSVGESPASTDS